MDDTDRIIIKKPTKNSKITEAMDEFLINVSKIVNYKLNLVLRDTTKSIDN